MGVNRKPVTATETSSTPNRAVVKLSATSSAPPCMISAGDMMKTNGIR